MDMSRTAGLAPIRRDRDTARPTAVTPKMLPFSTFGCRKSKNRKWRRWPNQVKLDSSDVLPPPTIIPERLGEICYKIFFRTMFAPSAVWLWLIRTKTRPKHYQDVLFSQNRPQNLNLTQKFGLEKSLSGFFPSWSLHIYHIYIYISKK